MDQAEARIGAELRAAQERGEVASADGSTHHRPKASEPRTPSAATLSDLGIPRQRAAEMKRLATIGEPAIRAEVTTATREGRRPARPRMLAAMLVFHGPAGGRTGWRMRRLPCRECVSLGPAPVSRLTPCPDRLT